MAESAAAVDTLPPSNTVEDVLDVEQERNLKYLGLIHVVIMQTLVSFSSIYDFAKERSGPLKPGVRSVEAAVRAVIGPVYRKIHGFPFELLKFADRKVDYSLTELDRRTPTLVRQASGVARSVAAEVTRAGMVGAAAGLAKTTAAKLEPATKEIYTKYEPLAERYAVSAWTSLNKLPLFPHVAQIVVPTLAYWSDKYNKVVQYGKEKGYVVAVVLPAVPIERIAKVFGAPASGCCPHGQVNQEAAAVSE